MPKITDEKIITKKEYISIINLLKNCTVHHDRKTDKIITKGLKFNQLIYC